MEKRKKEQQTTDHLRGVLRGNAFESDCTVALSTRLNHEKPSVSIWTSLRITQSALTPPDGSYSLEVHGRVFNVERVGGQWSKLDL